MKDDKSANQGYGIILAMRGRHKIYKTEAQRQDSRLESSRRSHAKARREAWSKLHKSPSRTSTNPPPPLDELREAYRLRNESCEAMIRLGSMLEDIEAAHGVGYKFESYGIDGTDADYFVDEYDAPWQTGIRGFLKDAPDLLAVYKTLMRYKKLSADFRDSIELYDPNPASLVFDGPDEAWLLPARKHAHEILNGCGRSFRALVKRIADFRQQSGLSPEPRREIPPNANPQTKQRPAMCAEPRRDVTVGVRGKLPPVDVGRSGDA